MRSSALAEHPDLPLPILLCPIRSARRMRLRIKGQQQLKLTYPASLSRAKAIAWAAEQSEWVHRQLSEMGPAEPFVPGATIPVEGEDVRLVWLESEPRTPRLANGALTAGGPRAGFESRIERHLKRLALDRLSAETARYAGRIAVSATAVTVGDASTRWGSCSSSGRIRFSWRLIFAPPDVLRYVVAHEVAHLKELNHGPDFRRIERQLYGPGLESAKSFLRRVGPRLRRLGLDG